MVQGFVSKVNLHSGNQDTLHFYETTQFITVFTKPRRRTLFWASRIQFSLL